MTKIRFNFIRTPNGSFQGLDRDVPALGIVLGYVMVAHNYGDQNLQFHPGRLCAVVYCPEISKETGKPLLVPCDVSYIIPEPGARS